MRKKIFFLIVMLVGVGCSHHDESDVAKQRQSIETYDTDIFWDESELEYDWGVALYHETPIGWNPNVPECDTTLFVAEEYANIENGVSKASIAVMAPNSSFDVHDTAEGTYFPAVATLKLYMKIYAGVLWLSDDGMYWERLRVEVFDRNPPLTALGATVYVSLKVSCRWFNGIYQLVG